MRMRSFAAKNMNEAMDAIRAALGEDAIILTTKNLGSGKGVVVTAAIDEEAEDDRIIPPISQPLVFDRPLPTQNFVPAPQRKATQRSDVDAARQQQLREMEAILRYHSTPTPIVEKLLEAARFLPLPPGLNFGGIKKALSQTLDVFLQFAPLHLDEDHRIMLIGPPGVGKTMTIAKIASRMKVEKKTVHVITTDNARPGGYEQLHTLMSILGVQVHTVEGRDELKKLLAKLPAVDCTLIDSTGANPYDPRELKELEALLGIGGIEPVLVLPAGMDAQEAEFAARAFRVVADIKRLLVTRVDVARRYGSLIVAAHALGAALCHASGSAKVLGDFITLNAEVFSGQLMQHRLDTPGQSKSTDQGGSH